MCVACDHLTPISVRTHTTDPVPFCFLDSRNARSGPGQGFNEAAARVGSAHLTSGPDLIPFVLERMQEAAA